MPNMDFSSASLDDLRVPDFKSKKEKDEFLEAMYSGEVPIPIVFKAMGVDFTDPEYVAEAIRLRCIGALSSAAPGYEVTADDMRHLSVKERRDIFLDSNDRAAEQQVKQVRERHPLGILAGNSMKKLTGYNHSVDVYGKSGGVDMLCAGAGILNEEDLSQIDQYPEMEAVPIVSYPVAAKAVLRSAKRINSRIRMICVELPQAAGGHVGARNAEEANDTKRFDPVAIREAIRKRNPKIPVILAGAIAYRNQIEDALAMGYQGVGIGTRGLMTQESKLSNELIMKYYLDHHYKVVTNDSSPTGYPGRYIEAPSHSSGSPAEWAEYVQYAVHNCVSCIKPGDCEFLKEAAHPENVKHFCIGHDLPMTRFGEEGGVLFTGTERDRIMHDPIFRDAGRNLRVPSMEETLEYMLTHDAPPLSE